MKKLLLFIALLLANTFIIAQTTTEFKHHRVVYGRVPNHYAIMPRLASYEAPNKKVQYIFQRVVSSEGGDPDNVTAQVFVFDNEDAYRIYLLFKDNMGRKGVLSKEQGETLKNHWVAWIKYNIPGVQDDVKYYPLK